MLLSSNPLLQNKNYKKQLLKTISKTIFNGNYINGPEVSKFEKSFANFCTVKYAIGVNSGTDALLLSLKALNFGLSTKPRINYSHCCVQAFTLSGSTFPLFLILHQFDYKISLPVY